MDNIFFSYATEDRQRISSFLSEFQKIGLNVLIDYEEIRTGQSIPEKINGMVKNSVGGVIFYSNAYSHKPWTTEEQHCLLFRSVERNNYRIMVVRLDPIELPPLLAHRLWTKEDSAESLARVFAPDLGKTLRAEAPITKNINWLDILGDHDLEIMATAIRAALDTEPLCKVIRWQSKRMGAVEIYLSQPLVERFKVNLSFLLSVLEKISFLRDRLRDQIAEAGLGIFEGAFMLAERDKLRKIDEFRSELRSTLDAMVEQVSLRTDSI